MRCTLAIRSRALVLLHIARTPLPQWYSIRCARKTLLQVHTVLAELIDYRLELLEIGLQIVNLCKQLLAVAR